MVEPKGMVFVNEHETNGERWYSFSFSVSAKNQNGDWESASMPVRFWKEIQPPENKTRIKITDGWMKPFKFKEGFVVGWFVKAYELIGESYDSANEQPTGYTVMTDDELPF